MSPYKLAEKNIFRTWFLITVFLIFVAVLGYLLAYLFQARFLLWFAFFLAFFMSFLSWFQGDKIALALAGAKKINKDDYPELFRIVENITITADLPMPEVYLIEGRVLNAFATGKKPAKSAVAVTRGLLEIMEKRELEGVIAHELSHIKNRDTLVMLFAIILAGFVAILSDFFFRLSIWGTVDDNRRNNNLLFFFLGLALAVLAPIFAQLIQLAISRKREYLADASGALLTRDPEGLASALEKIAKMEKYSLNVSPAISPLFFAPLKSKSKFKNWFINLFSTHPPIEERIKALRSMI